MSKIMYMDEEYCGNYPSTSTPTAGIDAAFDSDAHINSEDMSSQDVEDFLADINAQGTPSEYRKLLWTNPNPTSSFAAQTVTLDLSSYDDVEIEMAGAGTYASTTTQTFKLEVNVGGLLSISANNIWWRYVTPRTTGVEFGAGYRTTTYGSGSTLDNNQMVPTKIYGIKYEKVAPPQVEYPNYSTEEQQVGTWITGKPLYRKVMAIQSLPNNTTAVYAHGISNIGVVSRFTLCWYDTNDGRFLMSPRIDAGGPRCTATMNSTNVIIEATGTNWSARTKDVFFIVEYTKTTD